MEMITRHIDSLDVGRATKANNRAFDIGIFKDRLNLCGFKQWRIGFLLFGYCEYFYVRKQSRNLDYAENIFIGRKGVYLLF